MTLPSPTSTGHLPVGVHRGSLNDIRSLFGSGDRRRSLMDRLEVAVAALESVGFVKAIYVDGCFLGPRDEPEDIDLLVVIERLHHSRPVLAAGRREALRDLRKLFKPQVEILFFDEGLPEVTGIIEFFQEGCLKHGKCPKGIVELTR